MKLGIISVQDAANCGAYLQGYALKKTLADLGHDAGFINRINSSKTANQFYLLKSRQMITAPHKYLRNLVFGIKKYRSYATDWAQFNYVDLASVDALILGSDEIWNVEKKRYLDKKYFGHSEKKCIAYAPSCSDCSFEVMASIPHIKPSLERMHRIMVRDTHTQENILKVSGSNSSVVCDPTVLIDFDTSLSLSTERKLREPFLLIYGYRHSREEEMMTKSFAVRHGLKIVSANFNVNWADIVIPCRPLEFPGIVAKAECVVTSSFHCSIFALKYGKRLAVFPSGSKVTSMLERYNADSCIISEGSFENFCRILTTSPMDYKDVHRAMSEDRNRSLALLKEALEV